MKTFFENIWEELHLPLKVYIKSKVNNEQEVEDILQTVSMKAYRNLHKLKDPTRYQAWVYSITRNVIIDFYKSRKQELNIDDYTEDTFFESQWEEVNVNHEIATCIKNMITHLPDKYRDALILTDLENLPQKELATRMNLSIPGAKSRVQRGRRCLRAMLYQCCSFEQDSRGNIINYKIKNKNCNYC